MSANSVAADPLPVLQPNDAARRTNDSARGESSVREAQAALARWQYLYSYARPDYALELITSMEYLQQCA
ncbi:MAG: hypothetical protein F4X92_05085 [Gammaproteobacteria bacterium]|nr:hypothetical protein [Gammaproteobacteria bacterium]